MTLSVLFLVIAVVLFGLGAFSRWIASPQPWYPSFICSGLFFWALSALWPMVNK
jgi:hypothetical protein